MWAVWPTSWQIQGWAWELDKQGQSCHVEHVILLGPEVNNCGCRAIKIYVPFSSSSFSLLSCSPLPCSLLAGPYAVPLEYMGDIDSALGAWEWQVSKKHKPVWRTNSSSEVKPTAAADPAQWSEIERGSFVVPIGEVTSSRHSLTFPKLSQANL